MSMVIVGQNFLPKTGGLEYFLDGLARHVSPSNTLVITPEAAGDRAFDLAAPYAVRRQPVVGNRPPRWWATRAILSGHDVRHTSLLLCGEWWPAARALSSLRHRPAGTTAVMLYGTDVLKARARAGEWRLFRRALAACDAVIAITSYTADLAREAGADPGVLHPGVDLDRAFDDPEELAERLGITGRPVVLTAARLVARKGHADFLGEWHRVTRRFPDAVWLVAGDGPERAHLEARGPESVRLLGRVTDTELAGLYRLADVHVLPGKVVGGDVEGFGMAAVEAGVAGTPTVATDVGGTAEAICDGGVLVPPGDPAAVADAVADLLDDAPRREALGCAARRRAETAAWPEVANRFRAMVGLDAGGLETGGLETGGLDAGGIGP